MSKHKFDFALTDPASVREIVDQTVEEYNKRGRPVTLQAIGLALGIHRDTVTDYADGKRIPALKEDGSNRVEVERCMAVCAEVQRARLIVDSAMADTLMEHGGNNGAMFLAKCCLGYQDKQVLEVQTPTIYGYDEV